MSHHSDCIKPAMRTWLSIAVTFLFLAQSATADDFNSTGLARAWTHHSSVISIHTLGGSFTIGVSAWHRNTKPDLTERLAPKARIMDVQSALAHSACADQNGVCILRTANPL